MGATNARFLLHVAHRAASQGQFGYEAGGASPMSETQSFPQRQTILSLMNESGVGFGTSGARGLVSAMTDRVCFAYAQGFLNYLSSHGRLQPGTEVAIGGDRRPSTPRIMTAVANGVAAAGCHPVYLGLVPSPAVALYGITRGIPTVMVTGSHIPADRNGMKFTTAEGEIKKVDEAGIKASVVELPDAFDTAGALRAPTALPTPDPAAESEYMERYLSAFPPDCLHGMHLGVYGHSAVGRELLCRLYRALGARVTELGFSHEFVPVDTEAIREEDVELCRAWALEHQFTAIVSTDGDSDRPLTTDEHGEFLRGDVSGVITASFLGANAVATPVSCNTALELSQAFETIGRTRIGSPFVIAEMEALANQPGARVVGYEANGGFLHQTALDVPGGAELPALPTRDATIVHLAVLLAARHEQIPVSGLLTRLPQRFTASGRDQTFETERSAKLIAHLSSAKLVELASLFGLGEVSARNETDGLRLTFTSGEILHLRPSGNAPELRCYAEADSSARATELVELGLMRARALAR